MTTPREFKPTDAARQGAAGAQIPRAEWAVAALGLLLIVGALWVLLAHGLSGSRRPPDVALTVTEVRRVADGWLVRFEAENRGDETAADLGVRGELTAGDSVVESAQARLDYLPGGSSRTGGLYFAHDPGSATLRLSPVGYQDP